MVVCISWLHSCLCVWMWWWCHLRRPWPEPVLWVVVCLKCKCCKVLVNGRHLVERRFWNDLVRMCDLYMLCRLCVPWCSLRWSWWLCLVYSTHIECYSACSCMGSHLDGPHCYGSVYCEQCRHCRVLCFVPVLCLVCLQLCKEKCSSKVYLQLLRGRIWVYMRCPWLCLCWIWDGAIVSQLPYVWYYVGVQSSFQHARGECESKKAYVF